MLVAVCDVYDGDEVMVGVIVVAGVTVVVVVVSGG